MNGLAYEPAHCIICGHAESEVIATSDDIRAEVEWLWEYHQHRLKPETPPEHLMDRVAFSQRPPVQVVRCAECGLVYRNPVEREHELTGIYAGDAPAEAVLRSLHETQLPAMRTQARLLHEVLGRGGAGLEVGSYVGGFLAAAREEGMQFEGLDINRDVNAFTRRMGFTVHDGQLSSFASTRTYDMVAIWNTFDQLADPRGAVTAAHRLVGPRGVLAIRVPSGAFYHRARRRRETWPLLAQNNLMTFPYRWGFTSESLSRLLADTGFAVVRMRGDVLVPIADEWTQPWAREEERAIKRELTETAAASADTAPWIEVYAIRD